MHKKHLFIVLTSAILPFLFKSTATAQQAAVGDNERLAAQAEPAVVRIIDGCVGTYVFNGREYAQNAGGFGSGFFINSDGYIATNAHVVEFARKGENVCKETLFVRFLREAARQDSRLSQLLNSPDPFTRQNTITLMRQQSQLKDFEFVHQVQLPNANQEPLPFEIKSYGEPTGESISAKDVAIIKVEIGNAPSLKIAEDSNAVRIQDHVTVVGYPASADDFSGTILNRRSLAEASFTDGRVSARRNLASGVPVLQISAPATHGNSGGPVLNNRGEVIGIPTFNLQSDGQQVSGFTFVIPANTIMEFVRQGGTTNEQGVVDEIYREGLDFFFSEQYQDAIAKFEEIKRLFPQHSEVDRLIQASQQAISTTRGSSSTTNPTPSPAPTNSPTQTSSNSNSGANNLLRNIPPWVFLSLLALLGGTVPAIVLMRRNQVLNQSQQSTYGNDYPPPDSPLPQPQVSPIPYFSTQPEGLGTSNTVVNGSQPFSSTVMPEFGSNKTIATEVTNFGSITCIAGTLMGKTFAIPEQGLLIGRDRTCHVVIDNPHISKEHLWIGVRNNRVIAIDKKSSNGTFLNKASFQRINEVYLKPGDELILADRVVKFLYNPPASTIANQTASKSVNQTGDRTVVESARLGTITCTSGALKGQKFEIPLEGLYVGRDRQLAQIVIDDSRVSKQHLWITPRNGRIAVVDKGSTNGVYLNQLGSERITDVILQPGDTIILCEGDVARFQYQDDRTTVERKLASPSEAHNGVMT
jgi:pSer/pThr/pTyr-binding forkhead associated (FHA) protein